MYLSLIKSLVRRLWSITFLESQSLFDVTKEAMGDYHKQDTFNNYILNYCQLIFKRTKVSYGDFKLLL